MKLKGSKTEVNILRTFASEARVNTMYRLYADKARDEGFYYVAEIFDTLANEEVIHAKIVTERFMNVIGSTEQNVKIALQGEKNDIEGLYSKCYEEAKEEGFSDIAKFFKELKKSEKSHRKRLKKVQRLFEDKRIFKNKEAIKWRCTRCGYIHFGKEPPKNCKLCRGSYHFYKRNDEAK